MPELDHPSRPGRLPLFLAALVGAFMLAGSLYLSIGLNLKACPLCLYERTFVAGILAALVVGLLGRGTISAAGLAAVCLPLAIAGGAIAGFHVYLDWTDVLDCPAGIFGIGAAPDQSLAGFVLLAILFLAAYRPSSAAGGWIAGVAAGTLIGSLLAFALIKSGPPPSPVEPKFGPDGQRILSGCEPARK